MMDTDHPRSGSTAHVDREIVDEHTFARIEVQATRHPQVTVRLRLGNPLVAGENHGVDERSGEISQPLRRRTSRIVAQQSRANASRSNVNDERFEGRRIRSPAHEHAPDIEYQSSHHRPTVCPDRLDGRRCGIMTAVRPLPNHIVRGAAAPPFRRVHHSGGNPMPDPSALGRYVHRVPCAEPPAEPADPRCASQRPHLVRRSTPHDGRSGRRPGLHSRITAGTTGGVRAPADATVDADATVRGVVVDPVVAGFADASIRLVLETVDGRRPVTHLSTVLDPSLVPTIARAARSPRAGHGTASLLRTRLRAVDADTVELFGSYTRGPRVFALAGRLVRVRRRNRPRQSWIITTLWLG